MPEIIKQVILRTKRCTSWRNVELREKYRNKEFVSIYPSIPMLDMYQ